MNQRQRRKWALEMAAALLQSDMDNFDASEGGERDEDEEEKRCEAVRKVADQLKAKADKMRA